MYQPKIAPPTIKEIRRDYPDEDDDDKKKKKKKQTKKSQDSVNLLRQSVATTLKLLNEFEP